MLRKFSAKVIPEKINKTQLFSNDQTVNSMSKVDISFPKWIEKSINKSIQAAVL